MPVQAIITDLSALYRGGFSGGFLGCVDDQVELILQGQLG